MNKYVLGVNGMQCGMCELHVEEVISKNIKVKKVKASRFKKQVIVFTELNLDKEEEFVVYCFHVNKFYFFVTNFL